MQNQTKHIIRGVFARYFGAFLEFITFNFCNTIFFNLLWKQPNFIFKLIYFVILFFILKMEHKISTAYILKYTTSIPALAIMQQRRKYIFFTVFYFIAYLGAKYTEPNSLFLNYTTTCLVSYFVGWLIVRRKKTGNNLAK